MSAARHSMVARNRRIGVLLRSCNRVVRPGVTPGQPCHRDVRAKGGTAGTRTGTSDGGNPIKSAGGPRKEFLRECSGIAWEKGPETAFGQLERLASRTQAG